MIFDTLRHASRYSLLGTRLARGFAWFDGFSAEMPLGRYEIAGDEAFALVQGYQTSDPIEKRFEAHRTYADIQYVAAGVEAIYYAPLNGLRALTEYDAARDCQFFADPAGATTLCLGAGNFAVFFPQDGHKPGCISGRVSTVKKVVIKIRL